MTDVTRNDSSFHSVVAGMIYFSLARDVSVKLRFFHKSPPMMSNYKITFHRANIRVNSDHFYIGSISCTPHDTITLYSYFRNQYFMTHVMRIALIIYK